MIQIHPKRAFLNTEVRISNMGKEPVHIKDTTTHESFLLSPGDYKSSTFPAGKHKLTVRSESGYVSEETFVVEDAFKFGGSVMKESFIFDGNPWAILVMKDRTYFFNEQTGEQFVEHNLSPDKVEELSPDYLLFSTEGDYSLFSLQKMSIEITFPSSKVVYSGKTRCVLEYDRGLHLIRLGHEDIQERYTDVLCQAYCIDEETDVIYSHHERSPNTITVTKLQEQNENGIYEQVSTIEIEGKFVCFAGSRSALYTKAETENIALSKLYCKILSKDGSATLVYDGDTPLYKVNGIKVLGRSSYDAIREKIYKNEIASGEGEELSIEVLENSNQLFQIRSLMTITVTERETMTGKARGTEIKKESRLFKGQELLVKDEDTILHFSRRGDYDYVVCTRGLGSFLIHEGKFRKEYGEICFTEYDEPYIKVGPCTNKDTPEYYYRTLNGREFKISSYLEKSDPSYGLFYLTRNYGQKFYYWLKTKQHYPGQEISITKGVTVVKGGTDSVPPRFFFKNGDVVPVPMSPEDLLSLSSSGKSALYKKGGFYCIARYVDEEWKYKEGIVLSIYDNLKVKDAVFCTDGDSFVYQKDDKMVLYDFTTGEETEFPSQSGIKYNVNGYRPYCERDFCSRPVIIDPLTHQRADNEFLSQYRFSNIEGTVFYEKSEQKHFLREDSRALTAAQYRSLQDKYNYSPADSSDTHDQIVKNRIEFCKRIGHEIKYSVFHRPLEITIGDFVKYYVVNTIEYAVINMNGQRIEVKIGAPLYFLNYVSFSQDSKKVAICGKYKNSTGICMIYDIENKQELHCSITHKAIGKTLAIWLGLFSKRGDIAYYDSTPNTYFIHEGGIPQKIQGRSLLTFSPSGKYIALSRQGYVPYESGAPFWGHQPACDVYVASTDKPEDCLLHFNDHGSGIVKNKRSVASASFSADDKKILTVSQDGVVVVRNLHLDDKED